MAEIESILHDNRVQRGIRILEVVVVLAGYIFGILRKFSIRIIDNGKSDDILSFTFNFVALVAMAKELGDAIDRVVKRCGPSLTSFLAGTGGNGVEIILGIVLLIKGDIILLQCSIVGSITSNLLLVLGAAFLVGGLTRTLVRRSTDSEQTRNQTNTNRSIMHDEGENSQQNKPTATAMTQNREHPAVTRPFHDSNGSQQSSTSTTRDSQPCHNTQIEVPNKTKVPPKIGRWFRYEIFFNTASSGVFVTYCTFVSFLFLLFSVYMQTTSLTGEAKEAAGLSKSRGLAVILLSSYFCLCIFQFVTNKEDFTKLGRRARLRYDPVSEGEQAVPEEPDNDDEMEPESTDWRGLGKKLFPVLALAALAGGHSEFLSDAITPFAQALGVSDQFFGFTIMAIVGNAGEHWSAVTMGKRDKLTVAIGIGAGSACQIGGFVFPLLVIIGWFPGVPDLAFPSGILINLCLLVGAVSLNITIQDGSTQYLEGVLLLLLYICEGVLLK